MKSTNRVRLLVGRSMTVVVVLFMLFDSVIHLMKIAPVVEAFGQLGFPITVGLGLVELACTVAFVIPRSTILGAVLLTGYLGGATAAQVRIGADMFPVVFPGILGVLLWSALLLRDERLRALVPLRG